MNHFFRSIRVATTLVVVGAMACGGDATSPSGDDPGTQPPATTDTTPLRVLAAAKGGRRIGAVTGTAFTQATGNGPMLRSTLARDFSMVWSGNYLKFSWLRPSATRYDFAWADSMVAFAQKNDLAVRGHTLVWHEQLSTWVTSGNYSSAQTDSILKDHITTVMSRYKGKVNIWDVVNEAVGDNGTIRTNSGDGARCAHSAPGVVGQPRAAGNGLRYRIHRLCTDAGV